MVSSNNRAVLITGAAKRIGRELTLELAKKGFDIALHCNQSKSDAQKLVNEIKDYGINAEIFISDLNQDCYQDLINNVFAKFPNLEIMVNNASIFEETPFLETTLDQLDRHFNINFKAPFFLTQNFAKIVKQGQVINFLDGKVVKTSKNYFSYLLSKKSLHDFTKMSAIELGPNIRVNAVAPGITELSLDIDNDEYRNRIINSLPLNKVAEIKEINDAVNYLINSNYLTGQILFVDSGENL